LPDLWVRSTPSGADSALSSEMLPTLFFRQLSWFHAALFRFWGITTAPRAHAHKLHIAKAMCTSAQAVDTSHRATGMATRPCVQAHDNTLRCTAAMATRPRAQAHDITLLCMAATAYRPCAQAHDNMLHRTAATATKPCVQVHNNTSCCRVATATRPCAQAHDNTSHRTAATTTRTGATKTTKLSTKPCIHVALHCGNNDNKYSDDNDEC
jgi:hypothetical protein